MGKRSKISFSAIRRNVGLGIRYPWIASKLARLQSQKWFLEKRYPSLWHGKAGTIKQVSIRITDICNLRCIMCGQWGETGFLHDADLKELKKQEVPVQRYIECFEDLVAQGHKPVVYLWGGEPTLYDGWLELLQATTAMKLPATIATNGTRIAQYAEELVDMPMFLLQVSVDGHNEELHNRIRRGVGSTNSFRSIQEGLDKIIEVRKQRKADMPMITTLSTISRDNASHLVDIYETYRNKADLCVFYPAWWIDEQSADAHTKDFERRFGFEPTLHRGWVGGWTPDDYKALNEQLLELKARSKEKGSPAVIILPDIAGMDNLKSYYTDHSATFGYDRCISIFQNVEIDSNGDLSPCRDYHDYVVGNIKDKTITELWNSDKYRAFRKSLVTDGLMPACTRCCGLMGY
ncbi:MAG: radical SAM protein [Desulfovibrio sp.]|nr:MAG: radical SAM protein [Desulfovibrio sp.]